MSDRSRPNVVFMVGDQIMVVFRYSESTSGAIIKPPWPLIFDLIDDPVAEWDLVESRLRGAWVIALARSLGIRLVAGELSGRA